MNLAPFKHLGLPGIAKAVGSRVRQLLDPPRSNPTGSGLHAPWVYAIALAMLVGVLATPTVGSSISGQEVWFSFVRIVRSRQRREDQRATACGSSTCT